MSAASRARAARDDDPAGSMMLAGAAPRHDSPVVGLALGIAIVLHAALLLLVELPERGLNLVPESPSPERPLVFDLPLPPPAVEPPAPAHSVEHVRRLPVPDSTPVDLEPLREQRLPRVPDDFPAVVPADYAFDPLPPALPAGPLRPGENGVADPLLLERVEPDYPELARRAQLSGDVVLQAVVRADGSVGEIQVLRCTRPGVGFERAAIDALGRWLYEPATQRGRPVDVFLIVHVRFVLH